MDRAARDALLAYYAARSLKLESKRVGVESEGFSRTYACAYTAIYTG